MEYNTSCNDGTCRNLKLIIETVAVRCDVDECGGLSSSLLPSPSISLSPWSLRAASKAWASVGFDVLLTAWKFSISRSQTCVPVGVELRLYLGSYESATRRVVYYSPALILFR